MLLEHTDCIFRGVPASDGLCLHPLQQSACLILPEA